MLSPQLASRLEHMILRPELLPADVHREVTAAMQRGLAGVVVAPVFAARVATMLQGSGLAVAVAVGFPHGTNKPTVKAIEATSCIKDRADEIWVVPHLPNVLRRDLDAMKLELLEIARAARATRRDVLIHVVLETGVLIRHDSANAGAALATALRAVRESACDGVVTASGFVGVAAAAAEPPAEEAVSRLRRGAEGLVVKAMVGPDDAELGHRLLDAGADRVVSERAADWV